MSSGAGVRAWLAIEDVTEQLAAQQALADQNLRLNAIIEATRSGTWEYNVCTGELRVNATWAAVLGYTPQELGSLTIDLRIRHAARGGHDELQQHFALDAAQTRPRRIERRHTHDRAGQGVCLGNVEDEIGGGRRAVGERGFGLLRT